MKLSFLSLASGSSGNCYYLGTPEFGVLIDAGIGIRTIKKVLKDKSIDFTRLAGILITHDHADHIKTVGCLGEKYNIPVYATEMVHKGIEKSRYVEEMLYHYLEDEIIVFADLGLWNGGVKGYKEMSNQLNEVLSVFNGDIYRLGLDNYNLIAKDCHHDGTNYYIFRQWKPEVSEETREKFLDEVYENKLTEKEFKRKLTRYTKSLKDIVTKLSGL